ncbi:MAG: cobaltochelatase subunit CobN [Candidatus Verstraetearchaeota archaeon]|nr:cobaltochelatase subunit CobN [Candidatus Verstraetearchaeota archaeon]
MKMSFILLSGEINAFARALRSFKKTKTGQEIEILLRVPEDLADKDRLQNFIQFAQESCVTIMHIMGGPKRLPQFDRIISALRERNVPVYVSDVQFDAELLALSTVEEKDYRTISQYLNFGGIENIENLFGFLASRFGGIETPVAMPKQMPLEGIYHPRGGCFLTLEDYLRANWAPERPTVGILLDHDPLKSGEVGFVDCLVEAIERQGGNALVVFLSVADPAAKGLRWIVENYFMKEGKPLVDAVISFPAHSLAAYMKNSEPVNDLFKELGVPVLKAIVTSSTYERWAESPLGLTFGEVAWNVTMPEFDGLIITVPVAAKELSERDPLTGTRYVAHRPIPERLDKLARLSLKWARLRHLPNPQRKVALIFHNYPPRNDNIGSAAGMDTAASAVNLLKSFDKKGYRLDFLPKDGKELMETVLRGLTNDQRWLSADQLAERAVAKIPCSQYQRWYGELPSPAREKMERKWGPPPGSLFNHKGDLLIPGVLNGNIFIGIQPPRGYTTDPASIYHSPDLPMPYHYHGYYRWIRDEFKADVVIHFGKHGTLEWLPGKSVGLSESCFPDIAIGDLPNVYPYLIDDPGEGTGAKRRSYACLVDYLIPVMHNADSYEDLAKLEVQMKEYYRIKNSDPAKLNIQRKLIWDTVVRANLNRDLDVSEEKAFSDFDAFLERLHAYLNELSDTLICDGLHILGEPPSGSSLEEFLLALTRLNNGDIPSLRESLAELKGYDYEDLLANRGKLRQDGRTNGDVINELNGIGLELIRRFHAAGFRVDYVDTLMHEVLGARHEGVRRCLTYISSFLVPALMATADELTHTLSACGGNYVPCGPSGAPTRGMADILPTGRNFYSIDPRAVPSPASWEVGVSLGDALLARYLKEEGRYPETVAMVVWATDCMRTNGNDVAEILYLMGIRPVWEVSSGRVVGLEPIPLEALKRPRIDVTIRISGLFRDNFPNLIHLFDDAVALAASLDEPPEKNYVRKHVQSDIAESLANGMDAKLAREEAHYRIFGDIPGGYGSGVNEAIEAKNWKEQKDLAEIYVTWGCYVYSKENFGLKNPELFKRRLSQVDLTVKNWDQREYDALQTDDCYSYHAGMDVAIKVMTGKAPRSYYGDSTDPRRVKVRSTAEEIRYCFRARLVNPKWFESLKKHGYHGASELSRQIDYVLGWDATEEVIEDWMYEDLARKFVLDKRMQDWLKEVNPYALQNMAERLLEAIQRGMWEASEEIQKSLQSVYLEIEGLLEGKGEGEERKRGGE